MNTNLNIRIYAYSITHEVISDKLTRLRRKSIVCLDGRTDIFKCFTVSHREDTYEKEGCWS